jgi:serine/threonine protein kinase/tetratricopeptide (TPR) repeat protein
MKCDREQELFETARNIVDPRELADFLATACAGNVSLRQRLDELLAARTTADDFFRPLPNERDGSLPGGASVLASRGLPPAEEPGLAIGRYRLLEKIGEGGFGTVYLAEQNEPVKRRVALKIIKLGMDTRQVVARFEAERQALALMEHPNIAKVFDGGATATGRPYFIMELVRGVRITTYCDENKISVGERLQLFIQVCQAVQHAHQKGIIHRDLKPSNILITVNDGVAVPKVIDFGIAKATQLELTEKTILTQFHHFIGTPAYMSPEQAELTSVDIDTRSDVYSLGVLLYELLTGKTPFEGKELLASGLDEMRRMIREKEPLKPSTRLSRERSSQDRAFHTPHSLFDPDLDWIAMKCLEKDRSRRYDTASSLAADVQRHLANEPVTARPPNRLYRIRRAIRRNKALVGASAAMAVLLLCGIGGSSWYAVREQRAKQRAERQLTATLKFMDHVTSDVAEQLKTLIGASRANRKLVEAGVAVMQDLRQDEPANPEVRLLLAQLYLRLGISQGLGNANSTGDFEAALHSASNAIHFFKTSGAPEPGDQELRWLGLCEIGAGNAQAGLLQYENSVAHYLQADHWATRLAASTNDRLAYLGNRQKRVASNNHGEILVRQGRAREAIEKHFEPLLKDCERRNVNEKSTYALDIAEVGQLLHEAGIAYMKLGEISNAVLHFRKGEHFAAVLSKRDANNADTATMLLRCQGELGSALVASGEVSEGERLIAESFASAKALSERDRGSITFRQCRVEISRAAAEGFTRLATVTTNAAERVSAVRRAEEYIAEAVKFLDRLPSDSVRNWVRPGVEEARSAVAALKRANDP